MATLMQALQGSLPALNLDSLPQELIKNALSGFKLEVPKNPEHGDFACNVSFLSKTAKLPPPKIASVLSAHIQANPDFSVAVVGGYLNFKLADPMLLRQLAGLLATEDLGKNDSQCNERILLEFVSANPTGPLHIGHGRWAALGDTLARILRHCGATVTTEFYVNDAGVQMDNIAHSLFWRIVEQLCVSGSVYVADPQFAEMAAKLTALTPPEELPYPGEYVIDLAQAFLADKLQREQFFKNCQESIVDGTVGEAWPTPLQREHLKSFAKIYLLDQQNHLLQKLGVHFDNWVAESIFYQFSAYQASAGQHDDNTNLSPIQKTLKCLEDKEVTYRHEEAVWFQSSRFGDEKDRVLQKSDGHYTYLMPDIAYHHDKFIRKLSCGQTYTQLLNIWGADHHGYVARMRGAMAALGHEESRLEILLGQLVNLLVDGERTRMGKRRKMLTLQDVVDAVGVDATRFWMVSKSVDTTLDFDVDLAASSNADNPVFYVQYAHARCVSLIAMATQPATHTETGQIQEAMVSLPEQTAFENQIKKNSVQGLFTESALSPLFNEALSEAERAATRQLILQIDRFELAVSDAARLRSPHLVVHYLSTLATAFHKFYAVCRILLEDRQLMQCRLLLVKTTLLTLAQGLELLGVSAPQSM
ncbi:MAG: arginine--tRNA ligase [Cyanobacteria bacterium P01_H01_bin.74]